MGCYIINGGRKLNGNIDVQGSKNSAVAVILASLTICGTVEISNVPNISDVHNCLKILEYLGCYYYFKNADTVVIDSSKAKKIEIPRELLAEMRASSYLLGAQLSRFGRCEQIAVGGCNFGSRPLDYHFSIFKALGANEEIRNGNLCFSAENGLKGNTVNLPQPSVGATVNAILCAVRAKGKTVIKNAAREPHVSDLCMFLNGCGANIIDHGTDTITVYGNKHLHGTSFSLRGDMIEAGTYIIATLVCGGKIKLNNAPIADLECFLSFLRRIGAAIEINGNEVTVKESSLSAFDIVTEPYPGFPTDLHPQCAALASVCDGKSTITETVFKNRFAYLEQLSKLGLKYKQISDRVEIFGNTPFKCGKADATDLRGGASLLIAALSANGESIIGNSEFIERGYSDVEFKLSNLGADIMKIET